MFKHFKDSMLAVAGGALLALMVVCNSQLARYTSSVFSSWVAHGTGAIVALLLAQLSTRTQGKNARSGARSTSSPLWFYLGGIPGAFTVILAALAVNGPLSLSGAIALMMVGQVMFGLVSDYFGWFRTPIRRIRAGDLLVVVCVLSGSAMIIFGGQHG
ncbi:DMT family transporter [Paludibacterium purpuratum]|uniref:Transporter family-2 protein n=1 Tax=Paludibacterium purpuratum TaxID=1144873 RepID=A0A4V3DVE4_9NEIS|nr:DMT family transporter [Paludibacterium purpuratum]TDR80679.1 transporter family-2 protein [Paludibacterium purpuratum]